jgi:hypothetical protein
MNLYKSLKVVFFLGKMLLGKYRNGWRSYQGCGVGVGRNFRWSRSRSWEKMYRLRLQPQSKILTRYSKSRALVATVTIRLILKYGYISKNSSLVIHVVVMKCLLGLPLLMGIELLWRSRSRGFKNWGVGVLKIEESESELLCTDSTALALT